MNDDDDNNTKERKGNVVSKTDCRDFNGVKFRLMEYVCTFLVIIY